MAVPKKKKSYSLKKLKFMISKKMSLKAGGKSLRLRPTKRFIHA